MALVKSFTTDFGTISVTRSAHDGSMAYYQNGCFHSQTTRHGVSRCVYVHVFHEIIRQMHARHVLIIGCAGGSLATMLRRLHCRVTVIDINFMSFAIARRYFHLPDDVRCIRRDGIDYLRTTRKQYDAIVVDVFGADNHVPRAFCTENFFRRVQKVLTSSGVMLMNVISADDQDRRADSIARRVDRIGMETTVFDWPGQTDRNTLIIGDMLHQVHIPSGQEPAWIKPDFAGMIRRKPLKHCYREQK